MNPAGGPGGGEPDVSVVVAVHNTMPYLTRCLTSLVEQSIGQRRMEAVVVDDGSTDGSSREIARFARRHPGLFTTVRQAHSGGPAAPSNRALEAARGRYVFFLGADDHLAPRALEQMVTMADNCRSDVLLCKMVPIGDRTVPTGVFSRTAPLIRLVGDGLPWALSNTKLFRRSLIEEHGLRYDESMPAFSDQPFVLEACVRAQRISVLADQPHYFAVRRADGSNITFRTGAETRLRCVERLFEATCRCLPAGPVRDAFHRRHFHVELFQLFDGAYPRLPAPVRQRVCNGAARLVGTYGDGVVERLDTRRRRTLELARRGDDAGLCAEIAADPQRTARPAPATRRARLLRRFSFPATAADA
ncbi:glycosyltransferase family 2 protein [Streptomyces albus]